MKICPLKHCGYTDFLNPFKADEKSNRPYLYRFPKVVLYILNLRSLVQLVTNKINLNSSVPESAFFYLTDIYVWCLSSINSVIIKIIIYLNISMYPK